MTQNQENSLAKAEQFFKRARSVAETDNFDYAIDLYLEGIHCAPEQLEKGHLELYTLAIHRQANGGKKPSLIDKVKNLLGRTPLDRMISAEYLLAKDPQHLPYAEAMLKAAVAGGYKNTARWIADMVFQSNNAAPKPSLSTYLLLKDSYIAIDQVERAVIACQIAVRLKPHDGDLAEEYKNLSAELAVVSGKYDSEEDFRHSIKDRQEQEKMQAQQGVVKTQDFRTSAVEDARKSLADNPNLPNNIFKLAKTLSDLEKDEADAEAMDLLNDAYETKKDFTFSRLASEINIRQLKRKIRQTENNQPDKQLLSEKLKSTELEHYKRCIENYPTDLRIKYEYAARLLQNEQYDDAIPMFQEAQRDPRFKIAAMGKIGLSFFKKGWFTDAIDVFTRAIDSYEIKDDAIAKELQYNLARSCEENGDTEKALQVYREIAQVDFAYKNVKERIEDLRNK